MTGRDAYDPYKVMHDFYRLDNPSEEEQFQFVEAMEYLIKTAVFDDDIIAFSYNLAMYYRDIRKFDLEKKYLELGIQHGSDVGKEQLGLIWYYGLCGDQDYELAYTLFKDSNSRTGEYMISDMYHNGQFVPWDDDKCRDILESIFENVESEALDERFKLSTLYPEIAVRLAKLNYLQERDTKDDLEHLFLARDILSERQARRPFWGNIKWMKQILDVTELYTGNDFEFIDLYDLLSLNTDSATVNFIYAADSYKIDIFRHESEVVYEFQNKWFHGPEDFLDKARIDDKRITTVYDEVADITLHR